MFRSLHFTPRLFLGLAAAVAATALGSLAPAHADVIDFSADTAGGKPNGFMSVQSSLVSFSDSIGAGLFVDNFSPQTVGNGLGVFGDDASALILDFSVNVNSLSLLFGNDDPRVVQPGDLAVLTAFVGATQVGQTTVVLNGNDLADQTIALSGFDFNRATFRYERTVGNPINLIEAVDNVTFTAAPAVGAIPEPGTFALAATGLLPLAGAVMRKRRRA